MGKRGHNATFNLFFLGLGWPWVGEFVGFIIIFSCFPTHQNLVLVCRKRPTVCRFVDLSLFFVSVLPPCQFFFILCYRFYTLPGGCLVLFSVVLSACRLVGLSSYRPVVLSACRLIGLSSCRPVVLSACRLIGLSSCRRHILRMRTGDGPGVHGSVQDHAEEASGVVQELVP